MFCSADQLPAELDRFCAAIAPFYAAFGFERLSHALATRPADRAGTEAAWDEAEAALEGALRRLGVPYELNAGSGAFYGPKIEVTLHDRLGRDWQCGTIQLDVAMPERFDLRYVDAHGVRKLPHMLHRALFGSLERFLGILLEQHGRALPLWLAPQQIAVLPIGCAQAAFAEQVRARLGAAGLRVAIDARDEQLGNRIADAHALAVPFMLVLGAREQVEGAVALREAGRQRTLPLDAAVAELVDRCKPPAGLPALANT